MGEARGVANRWEDEVAFEVVEAVVLKLALVEWLEAETRRDSRELEEWQEADVGVAKVTQGWMRTSSVVNLWLGSFLSRHRIKHLALELILSGRVNWPRRILANRPVCS